MKTKVVQKENVEQVPAEIIAQSIKSIAASVKLMRKSRLSEKAIVLLLSHSSGVGKTEVKGVLDALDNLERNYLKKVEK